MRMLFLISGGGGGGGCWSWQPPQQYIRGTISSKEFTSHLFVGPLLFLLSLFNIFHHLCLNLLVDAELKLQPPPPTSDHYRPCDLQVFSLSTASTTITTLTTTKMTLSLFWSLLVQILPLLFIIYL